MLKRSLIEYRWNLMIKVKLTKPNEHRNLLKLGYFQDYFNASY